MTIKRNTYTLESELKKVTLKYALEYMNGKVELSHRFLEEEGPWDNIMSKKYAKYRKKLRSFLEKGYVRAYGVKGKLIIPFPGDDFPDGNILKVVTEYDYNEAIKLFSETTLPLEENYNSQTEFEEKKRQIIQDYYTITDFYQTCIYDGKKCIAGSFYDKIQYDSNYFAKSRDEIFKGRYAKREIIEANFIRENHIDWDCGIIGKDINLPFYEGGSFETDGYAFIVIDFNDLKLAIKGESNTGIKRKQQHEEIVKYARERFPEPICASKAAKIIIAEIKSELTETTIRNYLSRENPEHFYNCGKRGRPREYKS